MPYTKLCLSCDSPIIGESNFCQQCNEELDACYAELEAKPVLYTGIDREGNRIVSEDFETAIGE